MGSTRMVGVLTFVMLVGAACAFSAAVDGNPMSTAGSQFWYQHPQPAKRNAVQLCGIRLVEAVRGFCKGRIFSGFNRRSDPTMIGGYGDDSQDLHDPSSNSIDVVSDPNLVQYNSLDSYWDKDSDNALSDFEMLWPHNPKSLAFKVLTEGKAHQRVRRTISDECCKKPCSVNDMAKYCSGGRGRRMAVY